jgi:glycosyltransferase involved in cell wall biosynthesis
MSSVDVIIPCYNYGRFLRASVDSVLTQTGVDVRVLIIDDASRDHTPDVGRELAREDWRVEFVRHAINRRHIATYNEGLEWASADYTLLISADDLLTPGALDRAARVMDRHPEVGLTYGRQITFQTTVPSCPPQPAAAACPFEVVEGEAFIERACLTAQNPVATPTAVMRTALQKVVGGYRSDLPHTADLEIWLRCAARAPVGILGADQAFKRMHGHNMGADYLETAVRDLSQRLAAFRTIFREQRDLVAGCDRMQRIVERGLAAEAFWAATAAFDRGSVERCRELLDFTTALDPKWRTRPEWARLQWKQRLGPDVWGMVRPVVDRLRTSDPGAR